MSASTSRFWRSLSLAVVLPSLLLPSLLWACTHYVGRGSDLYHQGRYIEAAHVLEKTETRLAEATTLERAAYGLYRGATLLRLGDLAGAQRWLDYAQAVEGKWPGSLRPEEQTLLSETLIALRLDLDRRAASPGR